MSKNMKSLFKDAQGDGLSQKAVGVLVENLNALTVAGAQGTSVQDLAGDEATLFMAILDESGSMQGSSGEVISAYGQMLSALRDSKAAESILLATWLFNTKPRLLHSFLPLGNAPELTDYQPDNETALFDAALFGAASVVAYGQDLRNNGIRTKVVVVVFTDGMDNASRSTADKVRTVVEELLAQEIYVFALVAFGQGYAHQMAASMGIPNVLEVDSDPSSIRRAMGTVSRSVIRASQTKVDPNAGSFFK